VNDSPLPETPQDRRVVDHAKLEPCPLTEAIAFGDFDCDDADLNAFIRDDALALQNRNIVQTTCIVYNNKVIGYYTLKCDALTLEKAQRLVLFKRTKRFKSYPAILIARMAIDKNYHKQKLGSLIIKIVKGLVWDLNKQGVGCSFIIVDAYVEKIDFYLKNGFEFNIEADKGRIKTLKLKDTVSMRLNIFK